MSNSSTSLSARARETEKGKVAMYSVVSIVSIVVTTVAQMIALMMLKGHPVYATIIAAIAGAIPSYYLNRRWVWGKTGKSHMRKEIIPFWVMALIGMLFGMFASSIAHHMIDKAGIPLFWKSVVVTSALIASYGALWVGKYLIFNKLMFVHHEEDLDPVLDGRSGIPT